MEIITRELSVSTGGHSEMHDITPEVQKAVGDSGFSEGNATVFIPGATGGVTTIEYEPGLIRDMPEAFERIAPSDATYHHDETWHDGNGHSHVRASMLGPSLTVPFTKGALILGAWQQIVLIDFDNKARERRVIVQILGD